MHILFLAGRELNYTRNDVLLRAFRRLGTVDIIGEIRFGSLVMRSLRVGLRTLPRLLFGNYDLVFVGFYGHFLMLPVGLLSRRPILFDAFISTYDTLSFDRNQFSPHSLRGHLAFWLDQITCRLANRVLLDTEDHLNYFVNTFNLPPTHLKALPVGCNEDVFYPQQQSRQDDTTLILYYSSYLPLHGVETVVRAAAQLRGEAIRFRLIGSGPEHNRVRCLANKLGSDNITFISSIPLEALPGEIAEADICLGGHFGRSPKAGRVIPGKIYQMLAMARPVIAADTPANQRLLRHAETAYLCLPDHPEALAAAILHLHQDISLRNRLATSGRILYETCCSEAVITKRLKCLLTEMSSEMP